MTITRGTYVNPIEELAEELFRGLLVPAPLDQDIEHVPLLVHRPPQIVLFTLDRQTHFVHLPLVTRPGTAVPELIGIRLAKLAAPLADRLMGNGHPAFQE